MSLRYVHSITRWGVNHIRLPYAAPMNRTDRLFALLLELRASGQDGGWMQADDLARHFGVSVRTIYRDVLALNESGVPVVSLPGRGYRLMDGYFLPPLHFTPPEAVMLMLGADLVGQAFDAEFAGAAASALSKLAAALPPQKQAEVQFLRQHLRFVPPDESATGDVLRVLRGAVLGRQVVRFTYHKPHGAPEGREVFPLGLVHLYGAWLVSAFDPERGASRVFRLSRMEEVRVTARTFTRDPAWVVGPRAGQDRRDVRVKLLFQPDLRRTLRERPNFFQTGVQDGPEGVEVTLQVREVREVLPWVLSWGAGVRVQEPPELLALVRQEARRMLGESS